MSGTWTFGMGLRLTIAAAAVGMSALPVLADEPEGRGEATLEMSVRLLDAAGSRKLGMMYMPESAKLTDEKPAGVTKEPAYRAKAKYATITIGNGAHHTFAVALDEPEGQDAKCYADLNGNGDLTDDGDGAWANKTQKEGSAPQYSGTYVFHVGWKGADGRETPGEYGLNFYHSPDRATLNYYRSSARTGKIKIDGKEFAVTLIENDNDGLYDKLYDPSKPTAAEDLPRPVWLTLDGDRFDIRGTFGFNGYNYIAKVTPDGSKLVMTPTMKQIVLPRPAERPQMLGAGGPAPDFEALAWNPDPNSTVSDNTFKISDYKGKKIVVLDLWATWCGPCMAGIPHIAKIAEEVKGQDVEVIALNVWDEQAAFERFAKEKGKDYAFKLARDPAGREKDASIASRLFRLSGIPATYVIDKNGRIEESVSGYRAGDKQVEHALVRLGVKIEGIKPEDAQNAKPSGERKTVPAVGLK